MEKLSMWEKFVGSADNVTKNAFSGRKLTVIPIMLCILAGHTCYYIFALKKSDFSMFDTILIIDYFAIGFLLGLITAQQLLELKNGKKVTTETTTTAETISEETVTEKKTEEPK
jgi:hypothetical protein